MTVEDVLTFAGGDAFSVGREHAVAAVAALMAHRRVGIVVVCDGKGRVLGVVSQGDIVAGLAAFGASLLDMPVRNIMSCPAVTCTPDEPAALAVERMRARRIRHLPVVEGDVLQGVVSLGDALVYRLDGMDGVNA